MPGQRPYPPKSLQWGEYAISLNQSKDCTSYCTSYVPVGPSRTRAFQVLSPIPRVIGPRSRKRYATVMCHASHTHRRPLHLCDFQVLSDRITTRHLKLTNTTEILYDFQARVSRPFFISQGGASWDSRAPHQCEEGTASTGQWLMIRPQDNMLVSAGVERLPHHPRLYRQHTGTSCPHLGTRYK